MDEVNWRVAGELVGRDLAERGGTVALIKDIGFAASKTWLDGVLDGLHTQGVDPKSIAIAEGLIKHFTTLACSEEIAYRGVVLVEVDEPGSRSAIVVAA